MITCILIDSQSKGQNLYLSYFKACAPATPTENCVRSIILEALPLKVYLDFQGEGMEGQLRISETENLVYWTRT